MALPIPKLVAEGQRHDSQQIYILVAFPRLYLGDDIGCAYLMGHNAMKPDNLLTCP